jgi:hypothetical protein
MGRDVLEGIHHTAWVGIAIDITDDDVVASPSDLAIKQQEVTMEEERAARKKKEHEKRARMLLLQRIRSEYALARTRLRLNAYWFYSGCIVLVLACFTAYAFHRAALQRAEHAQSVSTSGVQR